MKESGSGVSSARKRNLVSVEDSAIRSAVSADVRENTVKETKRGKSFATLGLSEAILAGISRIGFSRPTPVQKKVIPVAMAGSDVVAMARTGSGKTAAFVLPMLEKLKEHAETVGVRALILSPTRDLALQTLKFIKLVGRDLGLRAILVVGGDSMQNQFADFALNPDIVVATPGRLLHHILEAGISFKRLEMLIFDEADRMFEMGLAEQIEAIQKTLRQERQTMMFSATLPTMVYEFAKAGLNDPQLIRLDKHVTLPSNLNLAFFLVKTEQKVGALMYLFRFVISDTEQTIVFCATRHAANFVQVVLKRLLSIESGVVFGSMEPEARKKNVDRFRSSSLRVLIVTDVAARGIDIPALQTVVNYDMPPSSKVFVHRVGRVGRGNAQLDSSQTFYAYSLVSTMDLGHMCDVHRFLGKPLQNKRSKDADRSKAECYYGAIPPQMLDEEQSSFRNNLHDVELSTHFRISNNAAKNYNRTRAMASKEGAAMSKSIGHVAIHPVILALGEAAGADEAEEERRLLVQKFLGSYRPKETILEVQQAPDESKNAMAVKRLAHPERKTIKRSEIVVEEFSENDSDSDDYGDDDHDGNDDNVHENDMDMEDDYGEGARVIAKRSRHSAFDPSAKKGSSVKAGQFQGAYKDEKFFMGYTPDKGGNKAEIDGLRVRGTVSGERDVILDIMGDEGKTGVHHKRVWDRRKKRYVGIHEADPKHSALFDSGGARQLVNEAGKQISKKEAEKKRGKLYQEWSKKTRTHIPVTGELEAPETGERYSNLSRKSQWKNNDKRKELANVAAAPVEARDERGVKKYLQKKEQEKWKNMPKKEREKRMKQKTTGVAKTAGKKAPGGAKKGPTGKGGKNKASLKKRNVKGKKK